MPRTVSIVLALSILGCRFEAPALVASSSTLVASSDGKALYALNVDEGTVARVSLDGRDVTLTPAGSEPTRLTRAAGHVWVTLRGERTVVAYEEGSDGLTEVARAEVGAEPYGVVATADGRRVYVTVSMEDKVLELDGKTLEVLRDWVVLDEPRWLTLNGLESALFVASAKDGRFTRIDLESGETARIRFPKTGPAQGQAGGEGDDDDDDVARPATDPDHGHDDLIVPFDVIVTGDPALSADGDTLAVPVVYADTTTPVETEGEQGGAGGYASSGVGASRFNPALVLVPLDDDGLPEGEPQSVFIGVHRGPGLALRSYPSSAVSHPEGRYFVVTMEGSDAAVLVDSEPFRGQAANEPLHKSDLTGEDVPFTVEHGVLPGAIGFWDRPVTAIRTGAGPRGVAVVGDELYVHAFLDRSVGSLSLSDAVDVNLHAWRDRKISADDQPAPMLEVREHTVLEDGALPDEVRRGQRLFYSAIDPDITAPQGGVSCSTCHVDGRTDGRTWTFPGENRRAPVTLRQTPSLAGKITETGPFTWDGTVDTVGDEAMLTSQHRMGGRGLDRDQLVDLVTFIDAVRAPDTVGKGVTDALVLEGQVLFEREDVGCASCHAGARYTDGLNHVVLGVAANTPTLTGISATAPYLHDGSARTLRDVLVWAGSGAMGDTSMLSEHELDALEAYLRSL